MSKWIAEFELENGDTMPEHMDLNYMGSKIDFHCRPKEPIFDKIRADVINIADGRRSMPVRSVINILDKYKAESEEK